MGRWILPPSSRDLENYWADGAVSTIRDKCDESDVIAQSAFIINDKQQYFWGDIQFDGRVPSSVIGVARVLRLGRQI